MSIHVPENFYRQTITRAVTLTTGTNIYVSAHPSPAEGYIAISPASTNLREIVYYTAKGTDGNGTYITVTTANRGLGGTTAQTHAIGEPVRMNVSAETIQEISDALDQIVAGGAQDASTSVKGISKLSVAPASATEPIAVGTNDPRVLSNPAEKKFGGTGADGALAITSGATNIDCANAAVVIKNYTSISITGTGSLTFTNPNTNGTVIILKSQGNVTLTSSAAPMIDASGMGAVGITGGSGGSGSYAAGSDGNNGISFGFYGISVNGKGASSGAGAGGTKSTSNYSTTYSNYVAKYPAMFVGASGGTGDRQRTTGTSGNATAGNSGAGGGGLIIECGGAWNFTTASGISVGGKAGTAGSIGTSNGNCYGGGGGGGSGGSCFIYYNSLTSNSGTITIAGGAGGDNFTQPAGGLGYGGGGGGSAVEAGAAGGLGDAATGGAGATGLSLVAQNTEFA